MSTKRTWRRGLVAAMAAAALTVGMVACADTGGTGSSINEEGRGEIINMQFRGTPASLDPALQGTASGSVFTVLAYDPLIYMTPDGELVPDLATEWRFTDDSMTQFEMTLREGVTFASGKEFNAEAVKGSIDYFLSAGGSMIARAGSITSVDVVDEYTVHVNYENAFPDAARSFNQFGMIGNIIGPDGVADPDSLQTSMDGTGQYIYNREESVPDSKYVYDRNPDYWNPDAQQFERAVIHVMGDPNAILSAATTGQVDFAIGTPGLASRAADGGLELVTAPFYNWGLHILDREGEINPALADERVRQAMGLAIDREAVTLVYGEEFADANGQFVVNGVPGSIDGLGLDYDLERARELMAEAGYPEGFSMALLANSIQDNQLTITQAIINGLGDLGIEVELEVEAANHSAYVDEIGTKKWEATVWAQDGADVGAVYGAYRVSSVLNPFGVSDPQMDQLFTESLTLSGDERIAKFEQINECMYELSWAIPVFTQHIVNYVGPNITNVRATANNPIAMPVGPSAEYSWQPAQ